MNEFFKRRDHFFDSIKAKIPSHQFMIGYGSGCFFQKSSDLNRMIDFILVVDDIEEFHNQNMDLNPTHYTYLPSIFRSFKKKEIFFLNRRVFPLFYFTENNLDGIRYKYGVIQNNELCRELKNWTTFSIAGRFQKPILVKGKVDQETLNSIETNRINAVS